MSMNTKMRSYSTQIIPLPASPAGAFNTDRNLIGYDDDGPIVPMPERTQSVQLPHEIGGLLMRFR